MAARHAPPQLNISSISLDWSTPQTPPGSPMGHRSPSPLTVQFRQDSESSSRTVNSQSSILSLSVGGGGNGTGIGNTAVRGGGSGSGSASYSGSSVSDCGLGLPGTLSNEDRNDVGSCSLGSLTSTSKKRGAYQRKKHNNHIQNNTDEVICVDPYKILGLERGQDTTLGDIKKAYRRLALLSHPRRRALTSSAPMHPNTDQEQQLKPSLSTDDNSRAILAQRHCGVGPLSSQFNHSNNQNSDNEATSPPPIREEDIREWHFITVAASYETLSVPEHRKEYDLAFNNDLHTISRNDKNNKKLQKKKGFWTALRKRLDVNNSFDHGNQNNDVTCCGDVGGVGGAGAGADADSDGNLTHINTSNNCKLINVCGARTGTVNNLISPTNNMQSKRNRSRKLLTSRSPTSSSLQKPMLLRGDSQRGKSTGTVESVATEGSSVVDYDIRDETNNLFGGPLSSLYKARQYEPFSDAFELFRHEFGSDIFRSRSCFDDDDDDLMDNTTAATTVTTACSSTNTDLKVLATAGGDDNALVQHWLSGGSVGSNGTILNNDMDISQETVSSFQTPIQSSVTTRMTTKMIETTPMTQLKPALLYPVLPNIPQHVLQSYGILDGCMRNSDAATTAKAVNHDDPLKNTIKSNGNVTTEVRQENKNGVSSEITTTTKRVGNMRIVRTKIQTVDDKTGKKKTVTSVNREMVQNEGAEEEKVVQDLLDGGNKNSGMNILDLVHCCSFSLHPYPITEGVPQLSPPPPPSLTHADSQQSDPAQLQLHSSAEDNILPLPSPSTIVSTKNFDDKKALKLRMKKLFLAQQHKSRGLVQ